jgi:ATP-binding cassette, subfamily B, putative efflux pump
MFLSPTFLRFIRYARPYWGIVALAMFCGIMKFTLALALPGSLGLVMDYVLLTDLPRDVKLTRMLLILGMLSLAFLGRMPATYFRSYFAVIAGNRTIFDIRRDLFHHIQRLSMAFHANRRTGSTISRLINDLNTAQGILNQGVIAVGMDVIFLIGVVVFLVIWDFRLAAVSLATLPVYAIVFRIVNPRLRAVATQVQEEMEELSGEVTEKVGALQVVMSFTREKTEELNFFKCHRRYYKKVVSRERLRLFLSTTAEFLSAVGPIVVISYGGYRVISGSLTPGELLIFNGFLAHLYLPTRRLADYSSQLQEKLAAMDRVFELFDCVPDIKDAPDAMPISRMEGRIAFRDVHFSYLAINPCSTAST